jgi:hypothetical protein
LLACSPRTISNDKKSQTSKNNVDKQVEIMSQGLQNEYRLIDFEVVMPLCRKTKGSPVSILHRARNENSHDTSY